MTGPATTPPSRQLFESRMAAAAAAVWIAYIVALPFHRVWVLPWLGIKLQPPEAVFVGFALVAAVVWTRGRARWGFGVTDAAAIAWAIANLVALVWSNEPQGRRGIIEALGAAYVAGLYFAVRVTATPQLLDRFGEWFGYSAALAAALGIIGSAASYAGITTPLATVASMAVPYFGHAARAQAFTAGPQMLASILVMAVPLFVADSMNRGWKSRDRVVVSLLLVGLVATFSKTALCLAAAVSVAWAVPGQSQSTSHALQPRMRVRIGVAASLLVASLFVLGSHLMVLREAAMPNLSAMQLVAGSPLASFRWGGEQRVVMPTTYAFNKKASIEAIRRSWPAGLGPDGQPAFTLELQRAGRFPGTMWFITPHSTYLGTVAELGAAGLVALVLILVAGSATIRRLIAASPLPRREAAAYAGVGVALLLEAIATDVMNYRHYWFFFAVIASRRAMHADRRTPEP